MKDIKEEYFGCACFSDEHLIVFRYDEEYGDLWLDVHLSKLPFFKRILIAIKYIFGYRSKYGCFDSWTLNSRHVDRMISMLQEKKSFDEKVKNGYDHLPMTE